jgi:hypothetical protein
VPGEKQVGSVSIRVVPDTTRFKAELERQLASIKDLKITANLDLDKGAAQAELDRISAERPTITANLDLDTSAAEIQKALLKKPVKIPAQVDVNQSEVARAAAKLKAVHIPADVDSGNLQSLVSKAFAGVKTQHIPVDIDQDSLARLLKPIDELHAVKVKVQADIDKATIAREVENLHLRAQLDIDQSNFHKALADAEAGFRKFDSIKARPDLDRSLISKALSDIGSLGSSVFSGLGQAGANAASNISDAFSGLGDLSGFAGFVAGLAKVSAIAAAVAVGGAAITAAWGAASTAVAAVPAAIGLIGAPLATVLLGMDGIKKAAAALTPEFDKLKASVSSTFQAQLAPVFNQLKGTLTALTPSIQAVATSMVGLAQQTANWITNLGGLQQIQTVFINVAAALKQIDLVPLLDGFTKLAGNQAALSALTTTINELGVQIQAIANNPALDEAFKGLEGTLKGVTKGFGDLVNNGIKLFAAAAPGVNQVVNALDGFFNQFDWNSLGTSVGQVFSGISQGIAKISPGTIDAIEASFAKLGSVFQDATFQQDLADIAGAIPAVVNQLGSLTKGVADAAAAVAPLITAYDNLDQKFQEIANSDFLTKPLPGFEDDPLGLNTANRKINEILGLIPTEMEETRAKAEAGAAKIAKGVHDGIVPPLRNTETELGEVTKTWTPAVIGPIQTMPPEVQKVGTDVHNGFVQSVRPVESEVGTVAQNAHKNFIGPIATLPGEVGTQTGAIPPAAGQGLADLPGLFADKANAARLGFGTGIKNISPETAQQLGLLGPAVTTGLTPAQDAAAAGATAMTTAFTTALLPLGQAFTTITPQITAFGTALTAMNPQLLAFGTSFTTLNPQLLAFGTNFTTINPQMLAFGTTLTTLNPQILALGTSMTTLNPQLLAFGTNFTTINPQLLAFGTTLTTLNPQLLAFGTTLTTLNPQMLALGTTFTTLNPQILAFGTTLTTLNPQILAFGTTLTTLNPQLMALSTSFTTINPALTAFSAALTAAAAAATAFGAAVQAAFTAVGTAVTTGMTTATTAVTTGFQTMTQTATTGGQAIVKAATTMMTDFAKAVTDGMRTVNDAVKTGMATALKTGQDAAKQFTSVGAAIDQGIAAGITQNSGIVQDAVRKVVADAKKAADDAAKVNSPSKLFRDGTGKSISEGLGDGILLLGGYVEDSARSVVLDAHAAAQRAANNLPDISDAMFEQMGLNDLGAEIEARVNASFGDFATSGAGQVINLTVQTLLDGKIIDERTAQQIRANSEDLLLKWRAG